MSEVDTLLIVNRSSGDACDLDVDAVSDILSRSGFNLRSYVGDDFEALEREAREAISPATRHLIVAGGDGSVSGFLGVVLEADLVMGIIPCGTANDFAKSIDVAQSTHEESAALLQPGSVRRVDVSEINGVPFMNAVGIGLGTTITKELDDEKKSRLGVLAYAKELWNAVTRRKLLRMTLTLDGETEKRRHRIYQLTMINGMRYGGGLSAPSEAALDDGKLHVLAIGPQSLLQLIGLLPKILFGLLKGDGRRLRVWCCDGLTLKMRPRMDVTVDGEIRTTTPCEVKVRAGGLKVLVPADADSGD